MNTVMTASATLTKMAGCAATREGFSRWSEVYDYQANRLLALEERVMAELRPDVRGLDVVDVGCGTGRWLARLAAQGASSLTGIDFSPEMVNCARRKLGSCATILVGEAESLPLPSRSADVLLASFVASYVDDLRQFAAEIRRVARVNARIDLSDLHPATAAACKWKRGFKAAGEDTEIELPTYGRSVNEVISCFEALGFEAVLLLEPSFGPPEREIFQSAGKLPAFDTAAGRPAIYILRLELVQGGHQPAITRSAKPEIKLTCARIALGPNESAFADLVIENGQISSIWASGCSQARAQYCHALDLDGYLLLPGLTNSHDHLEFGLFPNLGHGPYTNFVEWARNIHQTESDLIERQLEIPKDVRLWWGAIRNLLCGATTVCHHNPLDPVLLDDGFVVRVLTSFGWAHSVAMDTDLRARFQATPRNVPFVVHAAEGLDESSADEVFVLDRITVLRLYRRHDPARTSRIHLRGNSVGAKR